MREKRDQELKVVTAKIHYDKEKIQVRFAILYILTTSLAHVILNETIKEEDSIGEISSANLNIARRYPRFPKVKIKCIYNNRFKPKNLCNFYHNKSCEDKERNNNITFENDRIKIKIVNGILYNFENIIEI